MRLSTKANKRSGKRLPGPVNAVSGLLSAALAAPVLLCLTWLLNGVNGRTVSPGQVADLLYQLQTSYSDDLEQLKASERAAKFVGNEFVPDNSINEINRALELLPHFINPFEEELPQEGDAEVTPGFFEGDMVYLPTEVHQFRVAVNADRFASRRWDNATVPYVISPNYKQAEVLLIQKAIDVLNFLTCVRFVPWDGEAEDYLLIWPVKKPAGCYAFVGRLGGPQIVSLQPPDGRSKKCFISIGKPIHELMHSIGFFHEQSRSDRDQYVHVIEKNIITRYRNNFKKHAAINTTIDYTYDYGSVMHYGTHFFSANRSSPTMVPRSNRTVIGQRNGLSVRDCLKINSHYGCLDLSDFHRMKYEVLCRMMGLRSSDQDD